MNKLYYLFFGFFPFQIMAQLDAVVNTEAEVMPYFSGCEEFTENSEEKRHCSNVALVSYIAQNIRYPEQARIENVEGTVYASFIVNKDGKVSDPFILKDIGGGCAQSAVDVILNMPKWEPAYQDGNPVAIKLTIPIQFFMKEEEPDLSSKYKINWGNLKSETVTKNDLIENLDREVIIRDEYGEEVSISVLHFAYKRNRTFHEAKSTGRISDRMKKVVHKIKRGGDFAIKATIQVKGEMVDLMEVFKVKR